MTEFIEISKYPFNIQYTHYKYWKNIMDISDLCLETKSLLKNRYHIINRIKQLLFTLTNRDFETFWNSDKRRVRYNNIKTSRMKAGLLFGGSDMKKYFIETYCLVDHNIENIFYKLCDFKQKIYKDKLLKVIKNRLLDIIINRHLDIGWYKVENQLSSDEVKKLSKFAYNNSDIYNELFDNIKITMDKLTIHKKILISVKMVKGAFAEEELDTNIGEFIMKRYNELSRGN